MKILSREPTVHDGAVLTDCRLGAWTEIGGLTSMENTSFGDYSYTGPWCILQNAEVGKFANIAAAVRIGPTAHPMDRATLHHFTYRRALYGFGADDDSFFEARRVRVSHIGHDTWLGHGAIVMPGVRVGDGSVIGAGAVVTHDVPPYTVAAGVPARVIRERFPPHLAAELTRIAWWDWDHDTLRARLEDFLLPAESFVRKYRGGSPS
jgi:hypothetical protein